jgi:cytoskeletal protein CcmA (bactofilin family)
MPSERAGPPSPRAPKTGRGQGSSPMWNRKRQAKRQTIGRNGLTAFIDEDCEIEGRYSFKGTVMLNGRFKGDITSTDTLIIGERGSVTGDIRAGQVVISGEVVGNIFCTERVELKRTARVFADVEAPVVVVEEGVLFEGHCRMTKADSSTETLPGRELSVVPLKR